MTFEFQTLAAPTLFRAAILISVFFGIGATIHRKVADQFVGHVLEGHLSRQSKLFASLSKSRLFEKG